MAGFADWLCHCAQRNEVTAGAKKSLVHPLMFIEVGVLLLAAMLLETRVCVSAVQESLLKDNFILIEHMGVRLKRFQLMSAPTALFSHKTVQS